MVAVNFIGWGNRNTRRKPAVSHWQTLSHTVVSRNLTCALFELATLVVIGTDCIGSHKSNYHTITTTTVPWFVWKSLIKKRKICKCQIIKCSNSISALFVYYTPPDDWSNICWCVKKCWKISFPLNLFLISVGVTPNSSVFFFLFV